MSTNADRLALAVKQRRKELDISQLDVWQAGGPSNTTLTKIEAGEQESLSRTTARRLDKGLQWHPGSAKAVFDGLGDPVPADPPSGYTDLVGVIREADIPEDLRRRLLMLLESATG